MDDNTKDMTLHSPDRLLYGFSRGRMAQWIVLAIAIHIIFIGATSIGYIRDRWIDPEGAKARKAAAEAAAQAKEQADGEQTAYPAAAAATGSVTAAASPAGTGGTATNGAAGEENGLRQSGARLTILRDLPGFRFSPAIDDPLNQWQQPEWVSVTLLLSAHGKDQLAGQWAAAADSGRVRSDALAEWIGWRFRQGQLTAADVEQAIASATPEVQLRIAARTSVVLRERGETEAADQWLTRAQGLADALNPPQELVLPDAAGLLSLELPDRTPRLLAVVALSELASAQVGRRQRQQRLGYAAKGPGLLPLDCAHAVGPGRTPAPRVRSRLRCRSNRTWRSRWT